MPTAICSQTGNPCTCASPEGGCQRKSFEDQILDREDYAYYKQEAEEALHWAAFNIERMIDAEWLHFGKQERRGRQPELRMAMRDIQRIEERLKKNG